MGRVEFRFDKMPIAKSSLLLCFLSFLEISLCCKKTPEDMKLTTFSHPRELGSTTMENVLEIESTTSSTATETLKPTTQATTSTTEKPFKPKIDDATITIENEIILRWNNGVNMT